MISIIIMPKSILLYYAIKFIKAQIHNFFIELLVHASQSQSRQCQDK